SNEYNEIVMADRTAVWARCDLAFATEFERAASRILRTGAAGGALGGNDGCRPREPRIRSGARRLATPSPTAGAPAVADAAIARTESPGAGSQRGHATTEACLRSPSDESTNSGFPRSLSAPLRQSSKGVPKSDRALSADSHRSVDADQQPARRSTGARRQAADHLTRRCRTGPRKQHGHCRSALQPMV